MTRSLTTSISRIASTTRAWREPTLGDANAAMLALTSRAVKGAPEWKTTPSAVLAHHRPQPDPPGAGATRRASAELRPRPP